jgi:hypothetical protein
MARLLQILSLLFTLNYFFGFFFSFFKLFKLEYVVPVLDASGMQFINGVIITAGTIAENLLFLMIIAGSIPQDKKRYLSAVKGLAMWSFILSFAIVIMEGDIGHEMLAHVAQAGITVSRVIQIGNFIRGLEILVLMTYQYLAIMKTTIVIYSCYESSLKFFNKQKSKTLLIISAVLIFAIAMYTNSLNNGYFLSVRLGYYVILPFAVFVLILTSISVLINKYKSKKAS